MDIYIQIFNRVLKNMISCKSHGARPFDRIIFIDTVLNAVRVLYVVIVLKWDCLPLLKTVITFFNICIRFQRRNKQTNKIFNLLILTMYTIKILI